MGAAVFGWSSPKKASLIIAIRKVVITVLRVIVSG